METDEQKGETMSEIQRYRTAAIGSGGIRILNAIEKDTNGPLVSFEDHLAAIAEKDQEKEQIIKAMDKAMGILREELTRQEALFNPCGHTGFESVSCEVCGYPDSRKLIVRLRRLLESCYAGWPKVEPVVAVYEQYKHLDKLLSDKRWISDEAEELLNPRRKCLYDCWQAIRRATE